MSKLRKALDNPGDILRFAREKTLDKYIQAANLLKRPSKIGLPESGMIAFDEVLAFATDSTDISDHLPTLFIESLLHSPKLIVELGVRNGSSTFALERAAKLCNSTLVSVDIDESRFLSEYDRRVFVQKDDVIFAGEFPQWCDTNGLTPRIDVLFIDTSHEYQHTVEEIEAWFPLVSESPLIFFHDTNMREVYSSNNGELRRGWENDRGVIRAIEEYLEIRIDETRYLHFIHGEWIVQHFPFSSGLTILKRGSF